MLKKGKYPILDYDDSQSAVIMPDYEQLVKFPKKAVMAFLSEAVIKKYVETEQMTVMAEFETVSKSYPIYSHPIKPICLCQTGVGAPVSTSMLDWLYAHGVEEVVAVGSCGVLRDIDENTLLIPTEALRDEGTSYHYLPARQSVVLERMMIDKICSYLSLTGYSYQLVKTWTTDAFFRETDALVEDRLTLGYTVVEMECAALVACAAFRNKHFGQILFAADSLVKTDEYNPRDFGKGAH